MRTQRWPGIAARAMVAVLLVAACAPSASPSPSGAQWEPRTAWERALMTIDPGTGNFAKDDALRLFATAFGPIPGVEVQQDLAGVTSRTIAISAVMAHAEALTAEQRAAIDAAIAPPADAERIVLGDETGAALTASTDDAIAAGALARARLVADGTRPGTGSGGTVAAAATFAPGLKEALQVAAENLRGDIAMRIGETFTGRITISLAAQPKDEPRTLAQAWSDWPGGVFGNCDITIFSSATDGDPTNLLDTLAHELFHCFQFNGYHFLSAYATAPRWVIEGQARWVGAELTGGLGDDGDDDWQRYLVMPWLPLTTRSYDAVGFYAHLMESGTDPWTRFRAMWGAGGDSAGAFVNADAEGPIFLESWGSGFVREPGRGRAWDTIGPGITEDSYFLRPAQSVGDGDVVPISTPEFTADAYAYLAATDLIRINIAGSARLSDGKLDTTQLDGITFCVEGRECAPTACPGDDGPPKQYPTIGSSFIVGISGGLKASAGTIRGIESGSPEECESDPPPSEPPPASQRPDPGRPTSRTPCQTQCGESNGDVHIGTLSGFGYDFQGVGEFVLARSADGRFEVQTRQAPRGDSKTVSINTALAVRAGDHRMALYIDVVASTVRMTVDGAEVPMTAPLAWGAGSIEPSSEGVRIDTGDGSFVDVVGMSYRGFNLLVEPGAARLDGTVGLMGAEPTGSRWPALPDGSAILPAPQDRHMEYVQLYQTLADAWRVEQAKSLFDYAPGESTETFTKRNFPAESDLVYVDDLTDAQRAAGEAACADVTDEELHEMCVYDVAVTSDPGYGELYETTITLRETGQLGASGERVRVVNLYANEGRGPALDVYAWAGDAFNLGTNSGTGPAFIATVPYGQSSAWFNPGQLSNGPFSPVNWITIQRQGEAPLSWQFNLSDVPSDSKVGLERVLVLFPDPERLSIVGGTAASFQTLVEESPDGFPFIDAPAGKALGFLNPHPMFPIDEQQLWVASVGGRCLTDPDFPTLARAAQGFTAYPVVLEAGSFEVAIHEFPQGADGFDLDCGRFPVVARASVTAGAGDRVHLMVYAENTTAPVQLLALPVGD